MLSVFCTIIIIATRLTCSTCHWICLRGGADGVTSQSSVYRFQVMYCQKKINSFLRQWWRKWQTSHKMLYHLNFILQSSRWRFLKGNMDWTRIQHILDRVQSYFSPLFQYHNCVCPLAGKPVGRLESSAPSHVKSEGTKLVCVVHLYSPTGKYLPSVRTMNERGDIMHNLNCRNEIPLSRLGKYL